MTAYTDWIVVSNAREIECTNETCKHNDSFFCKLDCVSFYGGACTAYLPKATCEYVR